MSSELVVHGHFYQPPRENPWSGRVDREPSAAPFRDWNERVHAECYRPNGVARIVDERGRLFRLVNNYEWLSFDFGPTLLSWMEQAHPNAYARVLEADRRSLRRLGHGNAIAQGYNHAILPLCSARDRVTQVRWGLADFRHRFGREAESLWLPETACDVATLETLADEGMKYAVLAPSQAARTRAIGEDKWVGVANGAIDPKVPYRWTSPRDKTKTLALFFYDGAVSRAIAFEGLLASSEALVARFARAAKGDGALVHVATDGESYGHHFKWGDRGLAYALTVEAEKRGLRVTNYADVLDRHPPRHEAEIDAGPDGQGTAWSCAHGVGRWTRDCGCSTGGQDGWNQKWRTPLRAAMDVLRDAAAASFAEAGGELFADPWAARDSYIEVVLGALRPEPFLAVHERGTALADARQRVRARALLEAQRHAMLAYTSCGWFFSDLSGIETLQCLRYAARALDLLEEAGVGAPRTRFVETLGEARSNVSGYGTGADVYRRFVEPTRVTMESVAAHLAMTAVAADEGELPETGEAALHDFHASDVRRERVGKITLGTGRVRLVSRTTGAARELAAAAVHLGGVDFACAVRAAEVTTFDDDVRALWACFPGGSLATLLRTLLDRFGPEEHGLSHVLPDMRERISQAVLGELVERLARQYADVYEDNRRTIEMLATAGFPFPAELRAAAEIALSRRLDDELSRAAESTDVRAYQRAISIVEEAAARGLRIDRAKASEAFARRVEDAVAAFVEAPDAQHLALARDVLTLARRLALAPNLERAQEALYGALVAGVALPDGTTALLDTLGVSPRVVEASARPASIEPPGREGAPRP